MSSVIIAHEDPEFARAAAAVLGDAFSIRVTDARAVELTSAIERSSLGDSCLVLTEIGGPDGLSASALAELAAHHRTTTFVVSLSEAATNGAAPSNFRGDSLFARPSVVPLPRRQWERDLRLVIDGALSHPLARNRDATLKHCIERRASFELPNDPSLIEPVAASLAAMAEMWQLTAAEMFQLRAAVAAALSNAMYHGNLEVGDGDRAALAAERRERRPYSGRRIRVEARVDSARCRIVVTQDGPGFDHENAVRGNGWQAIHRLDEVRFENRGRTITLVKRNPRLQPVEATSMGGAASTASQVPPTTTPPAGSPISSTRTASSKPTNPAPSPTKVVRPTEPHQRRSLADELMGELVAEQVLDESDEPAGGNGESRPDEATRAEKVASKAKPHSVVRLNRDVTDLLDIAPKADPFGDD